MGLLELASGASVWRGYDYYSENRVLSAEKVSESEYSGTVSGTRPEPYSVYIDIFHPKRSTCTCPFAEGNRKVCKHKIALYFTVKPEEAERFLTEVEEAEREEEEYEERIHALVQQKIQHMKKSELQAALLEILEIGPDWVYDRFVRDYIDIDEW